MKIKQLPARQRIRQGLLLLSFLLFPVTLYYFSPALILQGASEGVINGSFLAFSLMAGAALFLGRAWCGWACPAGALQELAMPANARRVPRGKVDWIKWAIWIPWIALIAVLAVGAGGYTSIDPFYQIEGGATLAIPAGDGPPWWMIYYIILLLFAGLAAAIGRRAGCRTVCWMAPFMIIGRWLRNRVAWPALRLVADPAKCTQCLTCTRGCPMSLEVHEMVKRAAMEDAECILCGTCVDGCPQKAITYAFSRGK
ncbi:MAG: 4Fe-4S binding protein [Anaerolineae bacterium]|jgi:polyferredoxin|nr:4Fe-4S binding protein [Anaerolineae bacterium]